LTFPALCEHLPESAVPLMQNLTEMESALKTVKIIRLALLASVVLYGLVGELAAKAAAGPANVTVFNALSLVAIVMIGIIVVLRRTLVLPAQTLLSSQAANVDALNRWRAGYIATYAICEAVALCGLVLRFLGFSLQQVAPFYVAGLALMLFFSPRLPSRKLT